MTIARELANLLDTGGDVKLNQLDNYFSTGTKLFFPQAAAPTGWTQDPTASLANRSLRVVTGAGGGTGGSHDLNSPPSIAHTHTGPSHTHTGSDHTHTHSLSAGAHTLTVAEMPGHSHSVGWTGGGTAYSGSGPRLSSGSSNGVYASTGGAGSGGSHDHSLSGSITTPAYMDVIIASKD